MLPEYVNVRGVRASMYGGKGGITILQEQHLFRRAMCEPSPKAVGAAAGSKQQGKDCNQHLHTRVGRPRKHTNFLEHTRTIQEYKQTIGPCRHLVHERAASQR